MNRYSLFLFVRIIHLRAEVQHHQNRLKKGKIMDNEEFEEYISKQIDQIKTYRDDLERELGRDVGLDEAARRWIKEFAEEVKDSAQSSKDE